jgi:hypothetical protein
MLNQKIKNLFHHHVCREHLTTEKEGLPTTKGLPQGWQTE